MPNLSASIIYFCYACEALLFLYRNRRKDVALHQRLYILSGSQIERKFIFNKCYYETIKILICTCMDCYILLFANLLFR